MRLALIGRSVQHSRSPELYREIIGAHITYDLLDYANADEIPALQDLSAKYDGINITSPYKEHFLKEVEILDPRVSKLGAINTITFDGPRSLATNTDVVAVEAILKAYQQKFPSLFVILLGSGVMARLTKIVCEELGQPFLQLSRAEGSNMQQLDLSRYHERAQQILVINACSRQYTFSGKLAADFIFWDYNYHFLPHQNTLPSLIKEYQDGQDMLRLQALAAAQFWFATNPKLKS
jgi:shikimate dehydrogenase